jgi:tellurium resistance protein TerZ
VDVDLQAVAFDTSGKLMDAVYYNNLKAFGKGLTHSSDELTGDKDGIDEAVWADFGRLPAEVGLIVYIVACHSGGHLKDVRNGRFHVFEDSMRNQVAEFGLENSEEEVDLIAAAKRTPNGWSVSLIQEPAQDGQHFIDILEPTIGNYVRKVIPGAPRRIKACFAMDKGSVADLPRSSELGPIKAALGWDTDKGDIDLDVSAVLIDQAGRHVDTVFFSNLEAPGIRHSGDNLTGAGSGDDEVINVEVDQLDPRVQQVFFVINIYTRGRSFKQVANPYCRVLVGSGDEFCKFKLSEAGDQQGLLMARLVREPDRWGFQALGMPSRGSMWKDSMPDVLKYAATRPHDLQTARASTTSALGHATSRPSAPPRPSGTGGVKVAVVSASGLRAADWNGKSDPYCLVELNGQPSSQVRTSTKNKTLSPTWNETFVLRGDGSSGLKFLLYDSDMVGSDDFLGECALPAEELASGAFEGDLDVLYAEKAGAAARVCGRLRVSVQCV